MMPDNYLLSSAYFPPISYISLIHRADKILIEKEENYLKQTYRNRCKIFTTNGLSVLTVPVLSGASGKTCIKDIKIDYSKRWQQVHLRALISAYRSSAFFEYFFDLVEKLINGKEEYLLDLNMKSLEIVLKILRILTPIEYTNNFEPVKGNNNDFRYIISPKKVAYGTSLPKTYYQVFEEKFGFIPDLSVLDLIFNTGPDSIYYLT
jgi:hypothetical protein